MDEKSDLLKILSLLGVNESTAIVFTEELHTGSVPLWVLKALILSDPKPRYGRYKGFDCIDNPNLVKIFDQAIDRLGKGQLQVLLKILESVDLNSCETSWAEIKFPDIPFPRLSQILYSLEKRNLVNRLSNAETQARGRTHTVKVRLTLLGLIVASWLSTGRAQQ